MKAEEYIHWHYRIQNGMYFSGKCTKPGFVLYNSRLIDDCSWNYACLSEQADVSTALRGIEKLFHLLNRRSCLCFPVGERPARLPATYEECRREVWMAYQGEQDSLPPLDDSVIMVSAPDEQEQFLNLFTRIFCGEGETPWDSLGQAKGEALSESFYLEKFANFLVLDQRQPVAAATLGMEDGVAALYNLGTLKDFRGRGFASKAVAACLRYWHDNGGRNLFLQTEPGSFLEGWFERLGFQRVFEAVTLVKNNPLMSR